LRNRSVVALLLTGPLAIAVSCFGEKFYTQDHYESFKLIAEGS
jgi:guanyl-specific ribonuclease Sa